MKDHIWRRVLDVGHYLAHEKTTVREAARKFGVSKSTVHKDVTERLPKVNPELAERVKKVLEVNKAERHLRGGEATRRKYQGQNEVPSFPPGRSFLPEVE
ncbi:MAG: sporulation transcriptional regulator SpoIIID [Bacillota bacterium]|nr:sporulation transcriptional regulator SpoIIID [Bacillota bacterium]